MRVGGQQTHGLALTGPDGRSYTFRGVDKDPSNILPEELQDTFVDDLVQDQIGGHHPAGALVADELSRAVGVPTVPIRGGVCPTTRPSGSSGGPSGASWAPSPSTRARPDTAPGLRGGDRDRRPHRRSTRSSGRARRRVAMPSLPPGPALRRLLSATATGTASSGAGRRCREGRALAPDPGGPRPGLRALRGARSCARPARGTSAAADVRPEVRRIFGLTWNGREQDRVLLTGARAADVGAGRAGSAGAAHRRR